MLQHGLHRQPRLALARESRIGSQDTDEQVGETKAGILISRHFQFEVDSFVFTRPKMNRVSARPED